MVLPGRIGTGRTEELDRAAAQRTGSSPEAVRQASQAAIPAGRYGQVTEFAAVVAFCCGTGAAYLTGEQIRVDGGLVAAF
jgi:3-oxoacyl-[acyl-carrier protein] reductase